MRICNMICTHFFFHFCGCDNRYIQLKFWEGSDISFFYLVNLVRFCWHIYRTCHGCNCSWTVCILLGLLQSCLCWLIVSLWLVFHPCVSFAGKSSSKLNPAHAKMLVGNKLEPASVELKLERSKTEKPRHFQQKVYHLKPLYFDF